jgi:hypothetical protein
VAFSYAKNKLTVTGGEGGASGFVVAWLQGLSKTTTFYAALEKISNNNGTNARSVLDNALAGGAMTLGGSSQVIALGLNKKF